MHVTTKASDTMEILMNCKVMGSGKNHKGDGMFSTYLYSVIPGTVIEMFGMKFEVIKLDIDPNGTHTGLPMCSATSDGYLCLGADGQPKQLRLYKNHHATIDFDWSHPHYNNPKVGGNGEKFPKGVVHVQSFASSSNERFSMNARYMNNEEMETIGKVIRHYNPNVKFRS